MRICGNEDCNDLLRRYMTTCFSKLGEIGIISKLFSGWHQMFLRVSRDS